MHRGRGYGILGVVGLGVLLFAAWHAYQQTQRPDNLTTSRGQLRTMDLGDRSRITLNTDSSVAVDIDAHARTAHLKQGEAIFRVNSKDPRLFTLYSDDIVVSTQDAVFSARRLHSNALLVRVLSGSVLARETVFNWWQRPFQLEVRLSTGSGSDIEKGHVTIQSFSLESLECAWAWEQGELCLHDQPLPDALEEINRYTSRPVVMADASLASLHVGGRFRIATLLPDFAEALQNTLGIQAVTQADRILLLPPPRLSPSARSTT